MASVHVKAVQKIHATRKVSSTVSERPRGTLRGIGPREMRWGALRKSSLPKTKAHNVGSGWEAVMGEGGFKRLPKHKEEATEHPRVTLSGEALLSHDW
jgi:hypothetical protein